jgi:hypothetical protein
VAGGSGLDDSLFSLARLANDTGGRLTEQSNDLTLGFARAQRDLSCVYTVGFYDRDAREDRSRLVKVRVKRPGLRTMHPSRYVFRSDEARLESSLRAAFLSPELYRTGVVRAHVFPLRPGSGKKWDGLLAVGFPVPVAEAAGEAIERDFGAVLSRGPRIEHRFNRRITVRPRSARQEDATITFLEPVSLKPGRYELTVVMSDPDGAEPHSARIELDVPEVPSKEVFVVPPVLGRRAGGNVVVTGGETDPAGDRVGDARSFEPLLVRQLEDPDDLLAMTEVCLVGPRKRKAAGDDTIERRLQDGNGETLGSLPAVALELSGRGKVRCQSLVDVIPAFTLDFGEYVFEALIAAEREQSRFAVGGPVDAEDADSREGDPSGR